MGNWGDKPNGRPMSTEECACGRQMDESSYVCNRCEKKYSGRDRGKKYSGAYAVTVVHDPTNMYPRGSIMPKSEFFPNSTWTKNTLEMGYWPEGMVIVTDDGERYRVVGAQMEPQELEEVA